MNRLSIFVRHPRRILLAVGALAVAAAVAVGSGAIFTSSSANPNNTFTAGSLSQSNSKANAAILTASLMKPGDTPTVSTVVITNTGDIAGTFSLSESNVTSTPGPNGGNLSTKLDLLIEDVTGTPATVYTGKLSALTATSLGSFAASEARTYRFTVSFPDGGTPPSPTGGDNAYKGSAASAEFDWTSTS